MSKVSGIEPGQRQLNGPQTTRREYRNLSAPAHGMRSDQDVAAVMRDGVELLADVHRPEDDGRFPALISASPYPRQIQDLGAPMGFIEAGASDFWVPRGYVHVIANLRGTGGSGGTFGFFDAQERRDMHDLVEWAAAQPWCDGNVGMIGISYFAMSQLEAAVERPPHLRAIFPVAVTVRSVHVGEQLDAIAHHGGDVLVGPHAVRRFRQVAILAPGGLWAVEPALPRVDARQLGHGLPPPATAVRARKDALPVHLPSSTAKRPYRVSSPGEKFHTE